MEDQPTAVELATHSRKLENWKKIKCGWDRSWKHWQCWTVKDLSKH